MLEPSKSFKDKISSFFLKHFQVTIVLIIAIILIGGYIFLIKGEYGEFKDLKALDLEGKRKELTILKKELKDLESFQQKYELVENTRIARLKEILPSREDLPSLFINMEALASQSGFELINLSINEEEKGASSSDKTSSFSSTLKTLIIQVDLKEGSYISLKRFLEAAEKNLRIMDVENLNFDPAEGNSQITIKTYYLE